MFCSYISGYNVLKITYLPERLLGNFIRWVFIKQLYTNKCASHVLQLYLMKLGLSRCKQMPWKFRIANKNCKKWGINLIGAQLFRRNIILKIIDIFRGRGAIFVSNEDFSQNKKALFNNKDELSAIDKERERQKIKQKVVSTLCFCCINPLYYQASTKIY